MRVPADRWLRVRCLRRTTRTPFNNLEHRMNKRATVFRKVFISRPGGCGPVVTQVAALLFVLFFWALLIKGCAG